MTQVRRFSFGGLLMAVVAVAGLGVVALAGGPSDGSVRYQVTFIPSWNPETHPLEYPLSHGKQGLLTPMIGATHGSDFTLFQKGRKPSPGLERLSEMGKHEPLDGEIEGAIRSGAAGILIKGDMGSPGPVHAPVSIDFEVTSDYPMVSLVGMIAPSPDWFYGVSGVRLLRQGQWEPRVVVEAYAWDSGGDAGVTYLAEDQDLEPKGSIQMVDTDHFGGNGKKVPVGTFVFKRIPGARG